MRKIILFLCFAILSCMAAWAGSPKFTAKRATPTPVGAGKIYYYHPRGGNLETYSSGGNSYRRITTAPNDVLPTSIADGDWVELNSSDANIHEDCEVKSDAGKYGGEGIVSATSSGGGSSALYLYFFAKPNPGFRFLGWSTKETGATANDMITGNGNLYSLDSKEAYDRGNGGPWVKGTWNNGAAYNPEVGYRETSGEYKDQSGNVLYHYMRWVHIVTQGDASDITYYAYFEMIPQTFSFGGTGNEATYTASSGSVFNYNVGTEDMAGVSDKTAESIILTLNSNSYNRTLYKFAGWYYDYTDQSGRHTQNLLSTSMTATYKLSSTATADATWNKNVATWSNVKIYPLFVDLRFANFCVGLTGCQTLEQAIAAATDADDKTILVIKDYTVPEGNYTIPEGVTLLVPYAVDQESPATVLPRVKKANAVTGNAYRTLTLSSGVHLDVNGTIEVSGRQATGVPGAGGEEGIGCPTGDYGCMYMSSGSSITLNNGALLRSWGYVLGDRDDDGKYQCEIDARRGSRVQEQFQIMDWKGGTYTMGMTDGLNSNVASETSHKVLPINQYYIQNVEVPVKYRPGAKLQANASVYVVGTYNVGGFDLNLDDAFNIDNVGVIGARYNDSNVKDDEAIFLMDNEDDSEDTWVRKYYDVTKDRQVYEINNAASLGSLVLSFMGIPVSSTEYKLPITNNFKIHLLNGNMEITQHTEFLAGSELIVNKKSTMTIPQGVNVYLYDKDDWGNYISATRNANSTFTFGVGTTVKWRPGGRPTVRREAGVVKIEDTKFTISGTLDVQGKLFTTIHGATIISSVEDAGTIRFSADAPANSTVSQVISLPANSGHDNAYKRISCTSAQLTNEDGSLTQSYTDENHHAVSGQSYCFIDFDGDGKGEWKALATNGCFVKDENNVYYIKPKEYVAISQGAEPEEEADHTYRDHYAGTGRIFIQAAGGDCQWWEVRVVPGHPDLFECINENNHTFYYYDETDEIWREKKFKVSWVNWDGTPVNYQPKSGGPINYYMVTYGTVPQWLSANPTHADDASHTYSFNGWLPTPAAVTEDVTYTAQYEERDRMYAITFNDENGLLIQLQYCKLGEIPVCTTYDAAANNKVWKTATGEAIGAVAGDVTYKLFAKETKANYTIRFVNWNGTPIGDAQSVPAGEMPSAPANPTKASDDLHSYSFKAWNPALVEADADATYTATYEVGPRGYTVTWKNGEATLDTDENVLYGATPSYTGATPTKDADENYSYSFKGWEPAVAAVTGNATYTATFYKNINVVADKTISANDDVQTIVVDNEHTLTIAANKTVNTDYLILNATATNSGQLDLKSNAKINAANAYFDLNLNTDARHWHAFGVPWVVNLDVTPLTEVESGRTYVLGRDYDIIWYDGAERAANGPGAHCWKYVEHTTHILQPGQGYMIAFTSHVNTIRFAKATGTPVLYTGSVTVTADQIGAISNPMAYHATMSNTGTGVGQVHDGGEIGHDDYTEVTIENKRFVVGKTVYINPTSAIEGSVVINKADGGISPVAAPARRNVAANRPYLILEDYYTIALTPDNGSRAAKVYVLPEEDKADEYINGRDLAKFGMSDRKAQIWVNRYGTKLGLNTTAPVNDVAEFPVSLYAPSAGEYTISNIQSPITNDDYIVYLTQNGKAIWNLSDAPYIIKLNAGVNKTYGLRLSANKAPMTPTAIDEAIVDAQGETRKVLINNQVFIIRGNNVYSVHGQLVK